MNQGQAFFNKYLKIGVFMKAVIQIVNSAELYVDDNLISKINRGFVVYFCVEKGDSEEQLNFYAKKLGNMRIFPDENGKTNLSIKDINGEILLVSQFTLAGDCKHGNRPSFINAELPEKANSFYLKLADLLKKDFNCTVKLGVFGADMRIKQDNQGPFTLIL